MKKIIFFLTTMFLMPVFSYAQSNQVTLSIKLYPIQILEVHKHNTGNSEDLNELSSDQLIIHQNVGTYSTSNFALKISQVKRKKINMRTFFQKSIKVSPELSYHLKVLPNRISPFSSRTRFNPSFRSPDTGIFNYNYENEEDLEYHTLYSMEAL